MGYGRYEMGYGREYFTEINSDINNTTVIKVSQHTVNSRARQQSSSNEIKETQ